MSDVGDVEHRSIREDSGVDLGALDPARRFASGQLPQFVPQIVFEGRSDAPVFDDGDVVRLPPLEGHGLGARRSFSVYVVTPGDEHVILGAAGLMFVVENSQLVVRGFLDRFQARIQPRIPVLDRAVFGCHLGGVESRQGKPSGALAVGPVIGAGGRTPQPRRSGDDQRDHHGVSGDLLPAHDLAAQRS